jgi:hypothetical protein
VAQIGSVTASISGTVPISISSVTIGNSVTISSLPAISGTVTANTFTNLDWIYVAGSFTKTTGPDTTPTLYLNTYFKRDSRTSWSSWAFPTSEDKCTATIYNVIINDRAYWKLDVNYSGYGGPVSSAVGTLARFALVVPSIYSEIPPKTGWFINTDDGFAGTVSVSYEQPYVIPISGTVTVGNSVTVSSLPVQLSTTTIGGTARLNVTLSSATTIGATAPSYGNLYGGSDGANLRAISVDTSGRTVVTGSVSVANTVPVSGTFWQATQPVSGTVTANISSTTVTISAQPSGALTTRFGSVVTANTAGITTAVTNTSRKYLLAQNISTGTVTIGIGFSPTTTQGIQLTAGAGLTFDSFVPTGAVYWLGATTGAAYTILEG